MLTKNRDNSLGDSKVRTRVIFELKSPVKLSQEKTAYRAGLVTFANK